MCTVWIIRSHSCFFFAVGPNGLHIRIAQVSGIWGKNFRGMYRSIPSRSLPRRKGGVYIYTASVEFQGIGTYLVVLSGEKIHLNARCRRIVHLRCVFPTYYAAAVSPLRLLTVDRSRARDQRIGDRDSRLNRMLLSSRKTGLPTLERVRQETL